MLNILCSMVNLQALKSCFGDLLVLYVKSLSIASFYGYLLLLQQYKTTKTYFHNLAIVQMKNKTHSEGIDKKHCFLVVEP